VVETVVSPDIKGGGKTEGKEKKGETLSKGGGNVWDKKQATFVRREEINSKRRRVGGGYTGFAQIL